MSATETTTPAAAIAREIDEIRARGAQEPQNSVYLSGVEAGLMRAYRILQASEAAALAEESN